VYVERVALFDNKQRLRAKKAVHKALECQVQGRGFAFVEVLAECPLHLGKTPLEAQAWVKQCMLPVFPLGIKKDVAREAWPAWPSPSFDPLRLAETVGAVPEAPGPPAKRSAAQGAGMALKLAGAGGDGAQTAALLLTTAAIEQGFDATHIPSYGPESRGGTSYADVRIDPDEVLSPAVPQPDVLVAFNAPSVAKFLPSLKDGGTLIYDSSVVATAPARERGLRLVGVPATAIAEGLGRRVVKNIVVLGALQRATGLLSEESLLCALRGALASKPSLIALNEAALRAGAEAAAAALMEEEPCSPQTSRPN
jgi:2-oxoisovalerate ferredoxin oxidoreductase beta subunit